MLNWIVLLIQLLFFAPVGQETCNVSALQLPLAAVLDAIERQSNEEALAMLADLSAAIAYTRAACTELTFSSEDYGQLAVIGPVDIPAGVYRVTLTTDDFFILDVTTLEGSCRETSIFALTAGEASGGAQAVFESDGCSILLETEMVETPWVFAFEKLD